MTKSIFDIMQMAVDTAEKSEHDKNRIASVLQCIDGTIIAKPNFYPSALTYHFDKYEKIGDASPTVHAEVACLIEASNNNHATKGASSFNTDLLCPNCVKCEADAGISHIYIDNEADTNEFATRRKQDFEELSLHICKKAGINVTRVFRKEKRTEPIYEVPEGFKSSSKNIPKLQHIEIYDSAQNALKSEIAKTNEKLSGKDFAMALAQEKDGTIYLLTAERHLVSGYTPKAAEEEGYEGKYTLYQEPVNRILMTAAYYGVSILPGCLFSSQIPTSREQVNMVGAGVTNILLGNMDKARDKSAAKALTQLSRAKIILPKKVSSEFFFEPSPSAPEPSG